MQPPESPPELPTNAPQWEPPRGIYYEFARDRPKPFRLRWTEASGKPRSKSFATAQEREKTARSLADKRENYGKEVLTFNPREWRRWLDFKAEAGGVDPFTILHEWQRLADEERNAHAMQIDDAVREYADYRNGQKLSPDTRRHIQKHVVDRFRARFEGQKLRSIKAADIQTWLGELRGSKGVNKDKPVDPLTRRHHRKDVNTFFDYCITRGWLTRNPCALVPVPAVEEDDVQLMTVAEGRALFEANEGHRIVGRLALEAFGFLRASSAGRIQREHINFDERGIRMPGAEHKSRKAKFRQGHPDNLWAWLNRAPDETWRMNWWEYRNEKRDAFVRAGITGGSGNRLRKTCLSAHLAWLKNQPMTSYLAQHRHQSTTDIYLGVMTERDGAAWFQIGPKF